MAAPDDVLEYWFGVPASSPDELMAQVRRWFAGGPEVDREIRERFGADVHAALAGARDDWAEQPLGRLALILLLDQFTRNVLRNQPGMYAGDGKAQRLALDAFDRGMDAGLSHVQRIFLASPLLHAEDPALQRRSVAIARALAVDAPPPYDRMSAMHVEQAGKYAGVIERFGRFPHRNEILGRPSTAAEQKFLATWADNAPPRGAPTV